MLGLLQQAEFNWIWVTWSSGWSLKDEDENRENLKKLAQAGTPEMAVDCSVLRRSVRTRDLRVPITSADAALAGKVGHHLETTRCEACGRALLLTIAEEPLC